MSALVDSILLASKAPVPMCGALAAYLAEWRQQTSYNKDEDFIFASRS